MTAGLSFAYLGSGSRGNSALIQAGNTCVMLDCGFSLRQTEKRLARLGRTPADLDAVLVTHEHSDHIAGVGLLVRKYGIDLYLTAGTAAGLALREEIPVTRRLTPGTTLEIGGLEIEPVTVPHDAREPCQFVFSDGASRLGILTDTGHITRHVLDRYAGCQALVIECNHDAGMLANGPYPASLRQRVGGDFGHLSNAQGADMAAELHHDGLRHLVAAHLSDKNNTPALALGGLAAAVDSTADELEFVCQTEGLDWRGVA